MKAHQKWLYTCNLPPSAMKVKYRLIIILILSLIIWKTIYNFYFHIHKKEEIEKSAASVAIDEGQEQEQEQDELSEKVKISVYYEALCSDSRFFILKQLVPAYETIPDYVDVDLVPYGKAEVRSIICSNLEVIIECFVILDIRRK